MADPNKWLGLMKWSMKYADGTLPTDAKPMPKEDRDFLEKVLKEAVIDETERIQQILRILDGEAPSVVFAKDEEDEEEDNEKPDAKPSEDDLAEYKDALLDELLTRIDQIDNAMNFVKLDGLSVLMRVMKQNDRASTRALAAEVCSVVVQNNPFCQDAASKIGLLEALCSLLASDPDVTVQVKALLAISCLVRNHAASEARFLSAECHGVSLLQQFLVEKEDLRLQRKSLFFLRYLIRNSKQVAAQLLEEGLYISKVACFIAHDDVDLCESALEALTEFMAIDTEFAIACRTSDCDLIAKLDARIQRIDAMDDSDEEKEFQQEIKRMARELRQHLSP